MNIERTDLDHLLGLARHAQTNVERGNIGAVREALDDTVKRLRTLLERPAEDDDGDRW